MKDLTSVRIDSELKEQAKSRMINISGLLEASLREKLGKKEVEVDISIGHCEICHREEKKAVAIPDKVYKNKIIPGGATKGLTWLWPDEKWVCNSCLNHLGRKISAAKS